ncbi:MAG: 4Fe-4S binding protein, partial [Candidatus Ranarchaeia archaeon]
GAPGSRNGEEIVQAAKAGAGAIIVEGLEPDGCEIHYPSMANINGGIINNYTHSQIPTKEWIKTHHPIAEKADVPLIASVAWTRPEKSVKEAQIFKESIEQLETSRMQAFMTAVYYETDGVKAVQTFKKHTDKPVILKIPFSRTIHETMKEVVEAGVDAFVAIDGISGMRVNIDTGVPLIGGPPELALIIGRPIFPVAVYSVFKMSQMLKEMNREDIPIIGGGGINSGADCIEIEGVLSRLGVKHIHDVKDKTHKYFKNWNLDQVVKQGIPPSVDPALCTACGVCATSCPVQCIEILDIAEIDVSKCTGCALCVSRCSFDALQLPYVQMMPRKIRNIP